MTNNQETSCKDKFEELGEQMKKRAANSLGLLSEVDHNGKVAYCYPASPLIFVTFGSGFIVKDRDNFGHPVFLPLIKEEVDTPKDFIEGYMIDWKVFEEDFKGHDFLMDTDGNILELSFDPEEDDDYEEDEDCVLGGIQEMTVVVGLSELNKMVEHANNSSVINGNDDKLIKLRIHQTGIGASFKVANMNSEDFVDITSYENF